MDKKKIQLDEIERLRLENFQLKLELIDKKIKEVDNMKQKILQEQLLFAKKIEEKYMIVLDNYKIDLINGICF